MTTTETAAVTRDRTVNLPRARLVERVDYTADLMVVKLEPQGFDFNFKPGQYCTLGLDGIERAYSIVSAPHEPLLEIFVELVPEGELTPRMWRMDIGDTMSIRPRPKGIFLMDPTATQHLMLGTVTGVAPFVSIVRDHLHYGRDGHHFYVVEGASYLDEFVYDAELADLAAAHPDALTFVPAVSPAHRGAQRRLGGRNRTPQQHRRRSVAKVQPGPVRGPGVRLRPPRHDRGQPRNRNRRRLALDRGTLLEGVVDGGKQARREGDSHHRVGKPN